MDDYLDDEYTHSDENNLEKIEKDIKKLWDEIIKVYLKDINNKQILNKLSKYDYNKFFDFIIKESTSYNNIINNFKGQ